MFAVEVQDAQGRAVPAADNLVSFGVSGEGKAMGTGNGDPTDHEPDPGSSRKAFNGLCMALVQSSKDGGQHYRGGDIAGPLFGQRHHLVESREAAPAGSRVGARGAGGSGITGLWRPAAGAGQVFAFHQDGNSLTGTVEGGGRGGGDTPIAIQDGNWTAPISTSAPPTSPTRELSAATASSCSAPAAEAGADAARRRACRTWSGDRSAAEWFGPVLGVFLRAGRRTRATDSRAAGLASHDAVKRQIGEHGRARSRTRPRACRSRLRTPD